MTMTKNVTTALAAAVFCITAAASGNAIQVKAEDAPAFAYPDLQVYRISAEDENPFAALKQAVITERAGKDALINLAEISIEDSMIDTSEIDFTKTGIQTVSIRVRLAEIGENGTELPLSASFTEEAAVLVEDTGAPVFKLKEEVTEVDRDGIFDYASYISYISSDNGILPIITETDNVDTSKDGEYTAVYTAVDRAGNKTVKELTVVVREPQWLIEQRAEEERIRQEEEARRLEEERIAAEEEARRQRAIEQALVAQQLAAELGLGSEAGDAIAAYALQFVGCDYITGGADPVTGFDCSGFTMYVFAHFGINMPHDSDLQRAYGYLVDWSEARPGDLVIYPGHAAIYIGNGYIVNALNYGYGVKISGMFAMTSGDPMVYRVVE